MFFTLEIQEIRRSTNSSSSSSSSSSCGCGIASAGPSSMNIYNNNSSTSNINSQHINRNYKLQVKCFTTIYEIKTLLQQQYLTSNFPLDRIQLFHMSRSSLLSNNTTLHELGIDNDGHLLMLSLNLASSNASSYLLEPLKAFNQLDSDCRDLLLTVKQGFNAGQLPSKTDLLDCTGGVYFLKNVCGLLSAVFKPHDEEQGMPNNPKGYSGNGKIGCSLRSHFLPGEGYLREVATYLLDYDHFCNVPSTCLVHCEHPSFHYPISASTTSAASSKIISTSTSSSVSLMASPTMLNRGATGGTIVGTPQQQQPHHLQHTTTMNYHPRLFPKIVS
jgi:hypothetical protein